MALPPVPPPSRPVLLRTVFGFYLAGLVLFCWLQHKILFSWPAGIVTGNLLASAIWAPLAVVHLDRLARRHHREHMHLLRVHHAEHMTAIAQCAVTPPDQGQPVPGR